MADEQDLTNIWDKLLSRQAEIILPAYNSLDPPEKAAVHTHLQRMATEPDWHPEQRLSALAALKAIAEEKQG